MLQRILKLILIILTVLVFSFALVSVFRDQLEQIYNQFFPCQQPIAYNIGSFDKKFRLSEKDFLEAMSEAEAIWEKPLNKQFFVYKKTADSDQTLKINLIYDYRQQATVKLKEIGLAVSDTRASYDLLKTKYQTMQSDYLADKLQYQMLSSTFNSNQKSYTSEVDYWNKKGGAPADTYNSLLVEKQNLKNQYDVLNILQNKLDTEVANINAVVTVLNRQAQTLNLNVEALNAIGQSRGEQFTEGEYKSSYIGLVSENEIDVYEFSTKAKLVRLLAHELGHAIGLSHVEDPNAIMYKLNESSNAKLTIDDIQAVKTFCKIK